jgi:hypothetical protein
MYVYGHLWGPGEEKLRCNREKGILEVLCLFNSLQGFMPGPTKLSQFHIASRLRGGGSVRVECVEKLTVL